MVFNKIDRVIFRNLAAWDTGFCRGDMIKLPGPAWLWPKDYDFNAFGFEPEVDATAAKEVYLFMLQNEGKMVPKAFDNLFKSATELRWRRWDEVDLE